MNAFIVSVAVGFIFEISGSAGVIIDSSEPNTNAYLNTLQIIRKYGYPAEAHTVQTADGYLLQMHRIPHGKNSNSDCHKKRPTVFMHHGLLGSSFDFFLISSKNALPFLLSDLGFDVWLGNVRGNMYSRAHVSLFPNEYPFWNFTWHQSAIYDLPAQLNFISNHTNQEKTIYIGFSMGTTLFFVLTSVLPEYNDKIQLSLLLAPVAYVKNIKSPLLRFLYHFSDDIKEIVNHAAHGEFLPGSKLFKFLSKIICGKANLGKKICMSTIYQIAGSDPKEFDPVRYGSKDLLPVILNNYPTGTSFQTVNHYSQLVKSGRFRQYDYGEKGNKKEYGTLTPPDYNLSAITTPMYFYVGKNDYLSDLEDVSHLAEHLPTLQKAIVVPDPLFTHLDFLVSVHVKKLVYDDLINKLLPFLNNTNCSNT